MYRKALKRLFALGAGLVFLGPAYSQVATITPDSLDFGQVYMGDTASLSFVGLSDGVAQPLIVSNVYFSDDAGGVFEVRSVIDGDGIVHYDGGPFLPAVLPPEAFLTVLVTFSPTELGLFSGNLVFESNDHIDPAIDVPVAGRGIRAVAEPSTVLLLGVGIVGIAGSRRWHGILARHAAA